MKCFYSPDWSEEWFEGHVSSLRASKETFFVPKNKDGKSSPIDDICLYDAEISFNNYGFTLVGFQKQQFQKQPDHHQYRLTSVKVRFKRPKE